MVPKSFLKCGISNKMDGTEDDALYEDVADSGGYGNYYDYSVATCEIPDYDWVSFFADDDNDSNFEGF